MSKWTKEKRKRYLYEGRGKGTGADYKPWTNTYEFSSLGRATRVYSTKTERVHQLHSDNQYRAFLMFEFSSFVKDIRESYPLLDLFETINNKENLRLDKFVDKETKEPFVLTTNFLLTVVQPDGREKDIARTVKNTTELNKKITFEKLEIERRYWKEKNIEWKIITEKQLPRQLVKNIEWVRETLFDSEHNDKEKLSLMLYRFLIENEETTLRQALNVFDKSEGLDKGTGLYLFRYLIAKRELQIDVTKTINISTKIIDLLL